MSVLNLNLEQTFFAFGFLGSSFFCIFSLALRTRRCGSHVCQTFFRGVSTQEKPLIALFAVKPGKRPLHSVAVCTASSSATELNCSRTLLGELAPLPKQQRQQQRAAAKGPFKSVKKLFPSSLFPLGCFVPPAGFWMQKVFSPSNFSSFRPCQVLWRTCKNTLL